MTARLSLAAIVHRFGRSVVLDGVDLEVAAGGFTALIGPNGAGKTTLLRLASGAVRAAAGRVELDGQDLQELSARQRARRIGVVPQAPAIGFDYTVRELVALGRTARLSPFRGESAADRAAIAGALRATGLEDLAERPVARVSGGERQRAFLALALAQEPDVLLLDEPTANLDVAHQISFLELVWGLNQRNGLTVLATMHDLNLAALFFERIVVLSGGRIVADGAPDVVLTPELVARVFGVDVTVIAHPTGPVPLIAPRRIRSGGREGEHQFST